MQHQRKTGSARIDEILNYATADTWVARANRLVRLQKAQAPGVHEHAVRMGDNAVRLARDVGIHENRLELIRAACVLHDIGKIAVSEAIIDKPGLLQPDERREIERHTEYGVSLLSTRDTPQAVLDIAGYHHERYDGRGYQRLAGEAIPFLARIAAIVDVHEALTAKRAYKPAMTEADALAMMISPEGPPKLGRAAFDPFLLRRFVALRLRDPSFDAPPQLRADFWRYASSEPMADFGPEGHPEGFEIRKSGVRMRFEEGEDGVKMLRTITRPNGDVVTDLPRLRGLDLDRPARFSMAAAMR